MDQCRIFTIKAEFERRLLVAIRQKVRLDIFSRELMCAPVGDSDRLPSYSGVVVLHLDSKSIVHFRINGRYKLMPLRDLGGIRVNVRVAHQNHLQQAA